MYAMTGQTKIWQGPFMKGKVTGWLSTAVQPPEQTTHDWAPREAHLWYDTNGGFHRRVPRPETGQGPLRNAQTSNLGAGGWQLVFPKLPTWICNILSAEEYLSKELNDKASPYWVTQWRGRCIQSLPQCLPTEDRCCYLCFGPVWWLIPNANFIDLDSSGK